MMTESTLFRRRIDVTFFFIETTSKGHGCDHLTVSHFPSTEERVVASRYGAVRRGKLGHSRELRVAGYELLGVREIQSPSLPHLATICMGFFGSGSRGQGLRGTRGTQRRTADAARRGPRHCIRWAHRVLQLRCENYSTIPRKTL